MPRDDLRTFDVSVAAVPQINAMVKTLNDFELHPGILIRGVGDRLRDVTIQPSQTNRAPNRATVSMMHAACEPT